MRFSRLDGLKKSPYSEKDLPCPINYYGYSKLFGEQEIKKSGCNFYIFRISWLISNYGNNFLKVILRKAQNDGIINVVNNQYGVPTSTKLIAKIVKSLIDDYLIGREWGKGIYHLTPHGEASWYLIAKEIIMLANKSNMKINYTVYIHSIPI